MTAVTWSAMHNPSLRARIKNEKDPNRQFALGKSYYDGDSRFASDVRNREAIRWFRKAAEQSHLLSPYIILGRFTYWVRRSTTADTASKMILKLCIGSVKTEGE